MFIRIVQVLSDFVGNLHSTCRVVCTVYGGIKCVACIGTTWGLHRV